METLEQLAKKGSVNVISIGYNMKCNHVITKSTIFYRGEQLLIKNGGLVMICNGTDNLLLDTPENKSILKNKLKSK